MRFLTDNFKKYLNEHKDTARAQKEKAYLYSDLVHFGITATEMGNYFKSIKKKIDSLEKPKWVELLLNLWKQDSYEEKMLGLFVLNEHKQELTPEDRKLIEKLMRESKGWAFLDSFIIQVMPELLKKYPITYEWLKDWIKEDDFWVRRSALLAQLLFFRKNEACDKNLFFKMAESQLDEKWIDSIYKSTQDRARARFFIRKAIGWCLRDMSAKDPEGVIQFLNKNKNMLSGLSYREGSRKLSEDYKKKLK
jgi:3-methyladenine DNA glycosylase AlkD